jgi:6-pyruvoyltetrahydropterin/6-carboxytetrahydropterin synthase
VVKNLKLIVKRRFSAAHHLLEYEGNCANVHGHTWELEVYLNVQDTGEIEMDFRCAKELIELALPDHQDLNNVYSFNPTCENIAKELYTQLKKSLNVDKVVLWESSDTGAEYP